MTHSSLLIQITPESTPSLPSWMGEVAAVAQVLTHVGLLKAIQDYVQFARARFGQYDTIDFVVVLLGYALSGEATLQSFYERLAPFADVFMALFGRHHLPSRSALSRFLAALDQVSVEALRTQFQEDLLQRTPPFPSPGGLWDRCGQQYVVVDVDGTKQAARQRALPHLLSRASRLIVVLIRSVLLGIRGAKCGEVVRTRTTLLQAHTHQFLGTFGGAGNGDYRAELQRALQVITKYATTHTLLPSQILVRLDGLFSYPLPVHRGARHPAQDGERLYALVVGRRWQLETGCMESS